MKNSKLSKLEKKYEKLSRFKDNLEKFESDGTAVDVGAGSGVTLGLIGGAILTGFFPNLWPCIFATLIVGGAFGITFLTALVIIIEAIIDSITDKKLAKLAKKIDKINRQIITVNEKYGDEINISRKIENLKAKQKQLEKKEATLQEEYKAYEEERRLIIEMIEKKAVKVQPIKTKNQSTNISESVDEIDEHNLT